MARMEIIEDARRVGGWLSGEYEDDYVVTKDDGSCRKDFTNYEAAKIYQDHLQQIENQERLLFEQKRTADETAALRKAVEEQNKLASQPKLPPLPHRPLHDPEYAEFLMWKQEKARKNAQEKLIREQQLREMESKERARLFGVAQSVNSGSMPYNNDVGQILLKRIFYFTNSDIVLMIAENARFAYEFSALIKEYGKVKGVYEKILLNKNLSSCPNEIKELALANRKNKDFIAKLFSNYDLRSKCADYPMFLRNDIEILKLLKRKKLLKDYKSDYTKWADDIILESDKLKEQAAEKSRLKAELKPIEDAILKKEKLPIGERIKVAKLTSREVVMLKCVADSAKTVREAVKQNPNVTAKVLTEIRKREVPVIPPKPVPTTSQTTQSTEEVDNGYGCLWFIILIAIVGAIVYFVNY